MNRIVWIAALSLPLAGALSVAQAQAATVHVRGTIEKLDGSTLSVKSRSGETVSVHLSDDYKVAAAVRKSLSDIKSGDYVGVAATPEAGGALKAIEVTIFPAAQRGTGEGFRPYDLGPTSTMTNANVSSAVESVDGRTLVLTYKGGEKKVLVPKNAPVVTYEPASHADVKPGVVVSINAQQGADGTLQTNRFNIGKNGVSPPN